MLSRQDNDVKEKVAETIRARSLKGRFTKVNDLTIEPLSLDEEQVRACLREMSASDRYPDIQCVSGKNQDYFFSNREMTTSYAQILLRIGEKDLLTLIAEVVRNDSKVYPRPTDIRVFARNPFLIPENLLKDVLAQYRGNDEFSDIKQVTASNEAIYLYSDRYLSKVKAEALIELTEVLEDE